MPLCATPALAGTSSPSGARSTSLLSGPPCLCREMASALWAPNRAHYQPACKIGLDVVIERSSLPRNPPVHLARTRQLACDRHCRPPMRPQTLISLPGAGFQFPLPELGLKLLVKETFRSLGFIVLLACQALGVSEKKTLHLAARHPPADSVHCEVKLFLVSCKSAPVTPTCSFGRVVFGIACSTCAREVKPEC